MAFSPFQQFSPYAQLLSQLGHQIPGQFGQVGNGAGGAVNVMNIANGLQQGGFQGDAPAALNAANLYGRMSGSQIPGVGPAGNALAIYNGINQGGVMGYGSAAINAGQLYNGVSALSPSMGLGQIPGLGPAAAALQTYNAVKNWQSGATGSDALQGAEAGAAWGSLAGPMGMLAGALIGGGVGAISSAFGGGIRSQESKNWNNYTQYYNSLNPQQQQQMSQQMSPSMAFQNLQGVMNAHDNSAGHSEPIEQVWGRNNAQGFMTDLSKEINKAAQSGQITPGMSVQQQWNKVIYPWMESKGATINPNQKTSSGQPEGQALIGDIQNLLGAYEGGALNQSSQVGIKGQTVQGLQPFQPFAAMQPQQAVSPTSPPAYRG